MPREMSVWRVATALSLNLLIIAAPWANAADSVAWGITDRCITETRISNVTFKDDRTALVSLTDNKQLIMTLEHPCPGIQQNGYVHRTQNNRLCCGDVLRVLESGRACVIGSLEPNEDRVVTPENLPH